MKPACLFALAIFVSGIVGAYGEAPTPSTTVCVTFAEAAKQDAPLIAKQHLKVIELSQTEILSFNALLGNPFNDTVDTVTLFIFPGNHHAEFTVGNKAQDIKCSAAVFVLTAGEIAQLMRVIKAEPA